MKILLMVLSVANVVYGYNVMQVKTVQQRLARKQTIVASGCDFRGLGTVFKQADFSGAQLSGALFNANGQYETPTVGTIKIAGQKSDLTGANFNQAMLVSTGFKDAILQDAIFDGADISYADFSGADLRGARLDKAKYISLARFCGATMPDGTVCSGSTWKTKTGRVAYCHCPSQS